MPALPVQNEVLACRFPAVSSGGKKVDIEGVTGAIPVTPTILFPYSARKLMALLVGDAGAFIVFVGCTGIGVTNLCVLASVDVIENKNGQDVPAHCQSLQQGLIAPISGPCRDLARFGFPNHGYPNHGYLCCPSCGCPYCAPCPFSERRDGLGAMRSGGC